MSEILQTIREWIEIQGKELLAAADAHNREDERVEAGKYNMLKAVENLIETSSPWRDFREQRPADGQSYEFLWVEHYGTKRREIGTFSGVDGWIWVGGNGINPREKKAVFYRKLAAPPTASEIEAAMKGEE